MDPNPLLKKLGYSENDRVVIFHADDINMSQSSLEAYKDLVPSGLLSSAAAMVPCPWFPSLVNFVRQYRDQRSIDIGVHLTLTSEWEPYRWGPLTTADSTTGLVDREGYFFQDPGPLQEWAETGAVHRELVAQIDKALAAGIDVTHFDSHMGSLFHPRFLSMYIDLADTYRVPPFMLRSAAIHNHVEDLMEMELIDAFRQVLTELEANGYPLLDSVEMMSLDESENRLNEATIRLERIPVGISYFLIHPSKDTPELRAYAPDWRSRVADYELFMSDRWRNVVEASGIKIIGWRALRDLRPGL